MINIHIDEAVAYDMLSILSVKNKHISSKESSIAFEGMWMDIFIEVGAVIHQQVMGSDEYKKLASTNQRIFSRLNDIKLREPHAADALFIDDSNYRRYLAKRALQERFFPTVPLTERKIGYEGTT